MDLRQYQEKKPSTTELTGKSQVAALLAQAAISQAIELARMGRYHEAEQALGLQSELNSSTALDLLARIRAQQGRLIEAQNLWSEAARLDPHNESCRAALLRLSRMNRYSSWDGVGRRIAEVVFVALVLAAFAVMVQRWWLQERRSLLTEIRTALQPAPRVNTPRLNFQLQGVSERFEGDDVVLRFDVGLFRNADMLTPQAKTLLATVGQHLQPVPATSAICIIGYSDDLPVRLQMHFRDNRFLAVARAHTVAQFIASSTGIPERRFTLQSGDGSIYPNDSPQDRARNRSVEIRISIRPN
jgi:type VI secretion system protein ImpK